MADDSITIPQLNPVVFDKPQLDAFTQAFQAEGQNPAQIIAREIAGEVSKDAPEFFTYESLKDGTAKWFDLSDKTRDLAPANRGLTDDQIINLLAVDTEGNPIEAGTFLGGVQREALPSAGGFAGFMTGAKLGARAPIPHPLAKGAAVLGSGILGSLFGYGGAELLTDELLGPERPLLPGQTAAYEMGKTAAGVATWLPLPFMVSKNASLGTAQYLNNLRNQVNGPVKPSRSVKFAEFAERLVGKMGASARAAPVTTVMAEGIAGSGAVTGAGMAETYYPGDPTARLLSETGMGLTFMVGGAPFTTIINSWSDIRPALRNVKETYKTGGMGAVLSPVKNARQRQAVDRILEILEAEGEDVNSVIERLASDDLSSLLVDENGKPIPLTAGAKAGSPALLAIEASLDQLGSGLGKERQAAAASSIKALRNVILAMAQTGDQAAIQKAADLAEAVYAEGMANRLQSSSERVLTAFESVIRGEEALRGGMTPETTVRLSEKLYDVFQNNLTLARTKEKQLWKAVPEIDITQFTDRDGNTTNVPNFVTEWNLLLGTTPELADEFSEAMPRINQFVNRKTTELGLGAPTTAAGGASTDLTKAQTKATAARDKIVGTTSEARFDKILGELRENNASQQDTIARLRQEASSQRGRFSSPRTREFANALDSYADLLAVQLREAAAPASPDQGPVVNVVTSRELTDMRSLALDLGKKFEAGGEFNKARVAFAMADSFLSDLQNAEGTALRPDAWQAAYDLARSYSRALNDTFTRSIAGDAMATTKQGGDRLAPELLGKRILQGGNDPAYLRIEQINEIGNFAMEQGFEGAADTIGTLRGTTEQILRNARAAAFDQETGQINPAALAKWMQQNSDILDQFPALRRDLENARISNHVLREDTQAAKVAQKELQNQLSFYDLMNPVIDPDTGRRLGTESPTTAVARALATGNKTPIRDLNRMLAVAQKAPDDMKDAAMGGLKSSILEWAATKAGGSHSGTFSPSTLYDAMFRPIKGSENRISLVDWMTSKGVMNNAEVSNLKAYLSEMVKFEAAEQSGEIGELVERAGPILDFYLGITGSALGTRAQSIMTGGQAGPGALIAAGKGAETMRKIFADIPASMQTDVMSELMRNPELLAAMMRKPRGDKERMRLAQRVGDLLTNLGFVTPARRAAPSVIRETDESQEQFVIPPAAVPSPDDEAALVPPAPAPTPTQVTQAPSPVPQPPAAASPASNVPSGPVDRTRFAALFPNDSAAQMIRQGIGSL
jgi:hypothetical protein